MRQLRFEDRKLLEPIKNLKRHLFTKKSTNKVFRVERYQTHPAEIFSLYWQVGDASKFSLGGDHLRFFETTIASFKAKRKEVWFYLEGDSLDNNHELSEIIVRLRKQGNKIYLKARENKSLDWYQNHAEDFDGFEFSIEPSQLDLEITLKALNKISSSTQVQLNILLSSKNFTTVYSFAAKAKNIKNITVLIVTEGELSSPLHRRVLLEQASLFGANREKSPLKSEVSMRSELQVLYTNGLQKKVSVGELKRNIGHQFLGWHCHAGLEQILVDEKGSIFVGKCKVGGPIGHVSDKNFEFPMEPKKCSNSSCESATDLLVTKDKY